jgi:hypothetical protein
VVVQRINKNRKWYLENEKIDETDNYKYLDIYLSRAFIILDERETHMFSFSSISERSFIKIENRVGEKYIPV